ncbi:MAG: GNAT family N-acetyltransferase [Micrococcales bacterium]|nr:GNAT family N-acetyltransferase [Micrococcales bacterium]
MSEITVRALGEEDWQEYRTVRLAALQESPEAFVATFAEEEAYDEARWRSRMNRSDRLVAERDGAQIGVLSLGLARTEDAENAEGVEDPQIGEIFGLWVSPAARGTGAATRLVKEAARVARKKGHSHIIYWVGTENGRAVAFASGIGFRPTGSRRPMGVVSEEDGDQEIAMILSLAQQTGPQARF